MLKNPNPSALCLACFALLHGSCFGGGSQPPLNVEALVFQAMISSYQKPPKAVPPKFIKHTEKIHEVKLPLSLQGTRSLPLKKGAS
jgi:hypothetical protein